MDLSASFARMTEFVILFSYLPVRVTTYMAR
jgi:hypothetical protein